MIFSRQLISLGILIGWTGLVPEYAAGAGEEVVFSETQIEFFEKHVRSLLLENCVGCHSTAVGKVKGGLSLDSRDDLLTGGDSGPAIDLAAPDNSLLLEAVRRESLEMPPEKPLTPAQVGILERWLTEGAAWPKQAVGDPNDQDWQQQRAAYHWAWQPVQAAQPMADHTQGWCQSSIDSFVWQTLQQNQLTPTASASPAELLRRLYFDLIGLPPTIQQQQQFQNALSVMDFQAAFQQQIDHLLASPQFGVQWGRHWLDLMRYSETLGHEFDYPIRHIWQYRDSVVDALNQDVPYRQMIIEHLAGDLVAQPRLHPLSGINQSLASTGWWWLGDSVHAPVDIRSDLATRTENQVDVLSKSFLGMTVACARCHDHKFDAISLSDYYGMVGVAQSTRRRYAITDPKGLIAEHRKTMQQEMALANQQTLDAWKSIERQDIARWLDHELSQWRRLPDKELQTLLPPESPLFPLRLLIQQQSAGDDSEYQFVEHWKDLSTKLYEMEQSFHDWQTSSLPLADFQNGLPQGWTLETVDPENWLKEAPNFEWFDGALPLPERMRVLRSGAWGRKQYVTLRSPDFKVTGTHVCIKMRGKSAQSVVCVDNYFMGEFHGLLFGDLRKPIDQPHDWGWVTHAGDLRKYIGHDAFVSLEVEPGAWFEIAQVRLTDRGPPAEPHPWARALMQSQPKDSSDFRNRVIEHLHQALQLQLQTRSSDSVQSADVARSVFRLDPQILLGDAITDNLRRLTDRMQELDQQQPPATLLTAAAEGFARDAAINLRGNPNRLGESVPRGLFQSQVPWQTPAEHSSGRWELAQSLVDPKHPLVSRVIVNRIWHHLMGRGLVASPDNLGVLGSRPTHPELLDWLADQLIQNGWSIKSLLRQIVSSQTYQLSSLTDSTQLEKDADGSLLSHRKIRRLSAENLRDAILLTCESLDQRLSGPSVPVYLTDQMTGRGRPSASGPLDGEHRRSIYLEVRRNFLNPFLVAFDFPMPSSTTGRRNDSNVPAQALGLLNDPLLDLMSQRWAQKIDQISSPQQRIQQMFQTAFGRSPTDSEVQRCVDFLINYTQDAAQPAGSLDNSSHLVAWQDLAHSLLNAKEFWFLR